MPLKVWNGSSFIEAKDSRVWNGSTWQSPVTVRVWNGSSWVVFLNQVNTNNHDIDINVGSTFNGSASGSMTYGSNGTVTAEESRLNEGFDSSATLDGNALVGSEIISGEWLKNGTASNFQIRVTRAGSTGTLSGATFGTWTTMTGDVTMSVSADQTFLSETFTVQFRDVTTSTVLDTCTINIQVDASGSN